MIPKIIHYCWFGPNELSEDAKICIESWKKWMPDYEIKECNELNFDINKYQFSKDAYEQKKWAFVSDIARLDVVYREGGIYLDTDVMVIKPFDDLLHLEGFFGIEKGTEFINTGCGCGACKGNLLLEKMLIEYSYSTLVEDGSLEPIPCPTRDTNILINNGYIFKEGVHDFEGWKIFPPEYFCPRDYYTGKVELTEKTYSDHLFNMSWYDEIELSTFKLKRKISKFLPEKLAYRLSYLYSIVVFKRMDILLAKLKGKVTKND